MADISGLKVVITGGAGFVGSNLVERLCDSNTVYVVDNMNTGSILNLKESMKRSGVKLFRKDAKDVHRLGLRPDVIFHLGMYSSSPMYKKDPRLVGEVVSGAVSVMELAKASEAKVVIASTSSLYNGIKPPHKEEMQPPVTDYYTEARYAVERVAELYSRLHGVDANAMRFFSVYGYHEEAKKEYANLVSQFVWKMREGERPVIFGDGEQRRDFVFVTDVVEALIRAYEKSSGFGVFNVGTGKNYSLNETVKLINDELGSMIKPRYVKMPVKNYVMETLASTDKSRRMLGFKAKVDLKKGIHLISS